MAEISEIVGKRIRMYRTKKKWRQTDLAERAEINQTHLSQIERGEKVPTIATLEKIALALEIPLEILVEKIVLGDTRNEIASEVYDTLTSLPQRQQRIIANIIDNAVKLIKTAKK